MDLRLRKVDQRVGDSKVRFRSQIPPQGDDSCKCLIRFHNCTPFRVIPYWIDFKGNSVKYPDLPPGAAQNIDTFVSQLWYFRAAVAPGTSPPVHHLDRLNFRPTIKKMLAIPEDSLEPSCNVIRLNFYPPLSDDLIEPPTFSEKFLSSRMICGLCKHIFRQFNRITKKAPCPHYSGQLKHCCSDLTDKVEFEFTLPGAFVYNCSTETHKLEHSHTRRNVFLVESFYNLKENCYLSISDDQFDEASEMLPSTLRGEYVTFKSTTENLPRHDQPRQAGMNV